MKQTFFITGIGTDVGKTLVSAIITEALNADYWKPIQVGELENSDTHVIKRLISNSKTNLHKSAFKLKTPMSPHSAAEIDGIKIDIKNITRPVTKNNLVIEGAGGLLVPINNTSTVLDLIQNTDKVIVVSRHYLGSINHTLLTLELLKQRGLNVFGIIFNGPPTPSSEEIIAQMSEVPVLGRIEEEPYFDSNVVLEYAAKFKDELTRKR